MAKQNHNREVRKWAYRYAALGWRVIPIPFGEKGPKMENWLEVATSDHAKIDEYWPDDGPSMNIGVVTGSISGITVIDVDIADGKPGAETWAGLIEKHGEPATLMSITGSGGIHAVFKYNSALQTGTNRLGPGVDVRNDGGQIVVEPSVHPNGKVYRWNTPWEEIILSDLPAHLTKKKETRGRKKKDDLKNRRYSLEEVEEMLAYVSSEDRDLWRAVGIILGRSYNRSDPAWKVYVEWSDKWGGKKQAGHDQRMREAFYEISQQDGERELTVGTIVHHAIAGGWVPSTGVGDINNFLYFSESGKYVYLVTGKEWPEASVDAHVSPQNVKGKIVKASEWLKTQRAATSMTKSPFFPYGLIKGYDFNNENEMINGNGSVYNAYKMPSLEPGDPLQATPWIDHVHRLMPKDGDAEQFIRYMAQRVQSPGTKPRFALVIGGPQGTGKDTAIEMCVPAIGSWNVANINPDDIASPYDDYKSATLVRISEAGNLNGSSRFQFYQALKTFIAGNPDTLRINPKYGKQYSIKSFSGIIITTNHMESGLFIEDDDRRLDMIQAATREEMGIEDKVKRGKYFNDLWEWYYNENGAAHILAYLQEIVIAPDYPNNGQRETEAHKLVRQSSNFDDWLSEALEELGSPDIVFSGDAMEVAEKLGHNPKEMKRQLGFAMQRAKYVRFSSKDRADGRVKVGKKLHIVYYRPEVNLSELKSAILKRRKEDKF